MPPRTTTWELDDHTRGKHLVLKSYMDAWLPIILKRYEKALFVDSFAGPGEYTGGEPGSPAIALKALADHAHHNLMTGEMEFVFIEERADRFEHLEQVVAGMRSSLPAFSNVKTFHGEYDQVFPDLVEILDAHSAVPAFVMIDPFGVSGVLMEQVQTLMEYPSTEVYISLMYREINRFATRPEFTNHLNALYGCEDWKQALDMIEPADRKVLYSIYERQLREAGARYVLPFELYDGNTHVYTIFFATQKEQGCDKMKQAMWKAAPFGNFRFTGGMDIQFTLGDDMVDYGRLKNEMINEFGKNRNVRIESVINFLKTDRTLFHTGHRKKTLSEMERDGALRIVDSPRKRSMAYPAGTVLMFVDPPPPPPPEPKQMTFDV